MITFAKCIELADYYNGLSQASYTSIDRASLMRNIARSFKGVAGQLDRLNALTRAEQEKD
jgi:hypothetical protein